MGKRILLVDDRLPSRKLVASELEEAGFAVVPAGDGVEAWDLFREHVFDLVVTDLHMPKRNGLALLRQIRSPESSNPRIPVVLVSAVGTLSTAVVAGRSGATDFYPLSSDGIEELVTRAAEILRDDGPSPNPILAGDSQVAVALRSRVLDMAGTDSPVLIRGEKGTGRSSVATHIHGSSDRGSKRLIRVDSASADSVPGGDGEALFLAEVDRASAALQADLCQLLDGGQGLPASEGLRLLASSRHDLRHLADEGCFNPVLARWLSRSEIELPPLRERLADFEPIVRAILAQLDTQQGWMTVEIGKPAMERLKEHPWHGNLAELEEVLERLVVFARSGEICEAQVEEALAEVEQPLERIAKQRARSEREQLLALYRKHGTFSGVARELGITRNAAKYRFRKYDLLPANR